MEIDQAIFTNPKSRGGLLSLNLSDVDVDLGEG
jgi:hypothetical protein